MDDQINKKSIIVVFLALLIVFLFIYKGLILSGEEYLEEYDTFRAALGKQTPSLKKGNLNSGTGNKTSPVHKKVYDLLQNLEDLKLNLGALKHTLKNNDMSVVTNLSKLRSSTMTMPINVTFIHLQLGEIIADIESNKKANLDGILDSLATDIDKLRTIDT